MRAISIIGALAASLCFTGFAKASGEREYVTNPVYETVIAQPVEQAQPYYAPAYQPAPIYSESVYHTPVQQVTVYAETCPTEAEMATITQAEVEARLRHCPTNVISSDHVEMRMMKIPVHVERAEREIVYIKGDTEYVDRPVHIKGDTEYVPAPVLQCSQIAIAAGCSCSDTAQGPIQNCETTIVEPAPVAPPMMSMPSGPSFVAGQSSSHTRVTDTRGVASHTTYDLCLTPIGTASASYGARTSKTTFTSAGGFRLGGSND